MIRNLHYIYSLSPYNVKKFIVKFDFLWMWILSLFPEKIKFGGYFMHLSRKDAAYFRYFQYRENYEKTFIHSLLKLISTNPYSIFIDIGASYGAYTLAVANIGKFGLVKKIYAFEPDPRPYLSLKQSINENGINELVDVAQTIVGDYVGKTRIFFSERASTSNRTFHSEEKTLKFKGSQELSCITLDSMLNLFPRIHEEYFMIKFDVEGNEVRVLKGMISLLKNCKGFALLFEYYPSAIRDCGYQTLEFHELIEQLNPDLAFRRQEDLQLCPIPVSRLTDEFNNIDNDKNKEGFYIGEFILTKNLSCTL